MKLRDTKKIKSARLGDRLDIRRTKWKFWVHRHSSSKLESMWNGFQEMKTYEAEGPIHYCSERSNRRQYSKVISITSSVNRCPAFKSRFNHLNTLINHSKPQFPNLLKGVLIKTTIPTGLCERKLDACQVLCEIFDTDYFFNKCLQLPFTTLLSHL